MSISSILLTKISTETYVDIVVFEPTEYIQIIIVKTRDEYLFKQNIIPIDVNLL